MSNVSLLDVAELTAAQFRYPLGDLHAAKGRGRRCQRGKLMVRSVAVYLARIHTTSTWTDLARFFGLSVKGAWELQRYAKRIEAEAARDPHLARDIEAIEAAIDARHDEREGVDADFTLDPSELQAAEVGAP